MVIADGAEGGMQRHTEHERTPQHSRHSSVPVLQECVHTAHGASLVPEQHDSATLRQRLLTASHTHTSRPVHTVLETVLSLSSSAHCTLISTSTVTARLTSDVAILFLSPLLISYWPLCVHPSHLASVAMPARLHSLELARRCERSILPVLRLLLVLFIFGQVLVGCFILSTAQQPPQPQPQQMSVCRVVSAVSVAQALCSSSEMVVSGGGECFGSALSTSAPLSSVQGWQLACADGSVPASTSAQCCQTAQDTFAPTAASGSTMSSASASSSTSPVLPAGSFFSDCSWVSQYAVNFGAAVASGSVTCPATQSMSVTGGGMCPAGWALSASHSVNGTGWLVECTPSVIPASGYSALSTTMVQSDVLCCQAAALAAGASCRLVEHSSAVLPAGSVSSTSSVPYTANHTTLPVPSSLALCNASSELLIGYGMDCYDQSHIQQQTIISPYDLHGAVIGSCGQYNASGLLSVLPPALISYQCCPIPVIQAPSPWSGVLSSTTSNYCSPPSSITRFIGSVTSSQPDSPHAYGAEYTLACADGVASPASAALYLVGAASIECLADASWSSGGTLGHCLALDTQGCVAVQAVGTPASSSSSVVAAATTVAGSTSSINGSASPAVTTLSCPSSTAVSWVLVAAGGLCRSSISNSTTHSVLAEPTSLSSWQSGCLDSLTGQPQPAELVTGVCCPVHNANVLSSCEYVDGFSPSTDQQRGCTSSQQTVVLGHRHGQVSSAICCSRLSDSCVTASVSTTTDRNNLTVVTEQCPGGDLLLAAPDSAAGNESLVMLQHQLVQSPSNSSSRSGGQQWSKLSFTWRQGGNSTVPVSPSHCCPSQRLCSWSSSLSSFTDVSRTASYWLAGTIATYWCLPGYLMPITGQQSMNFECGVNSSLTSFTPPQCAPSVCSNLSSVLSRNVTYEVSFNTSGAQTRLTCAPGTLFAHYPTATTEVLITCTGSTATGGRDWQPAPSSLSCVSITQGGNSSTLSGGGHGRRLLGTEYQSPYMYHGPPGGTTTSSSGGLTLTTTFPSDPYNLYVSWSIGPSSDMVSLYTAGGGSESYVQELSWVVETTLLWPTDGVAQSSRSSSQVAALSGLQDFQSVEVGYNTFHASVVLDANNYIEGIQSLVALSIRKQGLVQTALSSVGTTPFVVFDTGYGYFRFRDVIPTAPCYLTARGSLSCDPPDLADPSILWTTTTGPTSSAVLKNQLTGLCLYLDIRSNAFAFTPTDCVRGTVSISDQGLMVGSNGGARWCWMNDMGWKVCSNVGLTPPSVYVSTLQSLPSQSVLVASAVVESPCGCGLTGDGSPTSKRLYQRSGVDTILRLAFNPQSMCNDEFVLVETTGGVVSPVDIPIVDAYSYDTWFSCSATAIRSVEVTPLRWSDTCVPRTFCLQPLPRSVCPSCMSEYLPSNTSPGMDGACVTDSAEYWFTVSGIVTTVGAAQGATAPVAGVRMDIQVVTTDPTAIVPVWSTSPLYSAVATTDNNGLWSSTISTVFPNGPQEYYEVLAIPSKSYTYTDDNPTIVLSSSSSPSIFRLAQIGMNEHLVFDFHLKQQTFNTSTTTLVAVAEWICPDPSGNVSTYTAFVCGRGTAILIQMSVQVSVVTVSTTVSYTNSSVSYTTFHLYDWDVPWNASLVNDPHYHSSDPLLGQGVFGLVVSNPYNDSVPLSATPYLLDSNGAYLSPDSLVPVGNVVPTTSTLAAMPVPGVSLSGATLVVPPTLAELDDLCAPVCDIDTVAAVTYVSGTAAALAGPVVALPPFTDTVVGLPLPSPVESSPGSGPSDRLTVTTASGVTFSYSPSNDVHSVSATWKQTPNGVLNLVYETDPTTPLVITFNSINVQSIGASPVFPSGDTAPVTLTLLNSTAVIQSSLSGSGYSSATRTFAHVFQSASGYDKSPIGSTTMTYGQTMYFPMQWYDLSAVAVSGTISIGSAGDSVLPGVASCGMANIIVSAFATDDSQFEDPIAISAPTDGSGQWSLALPAHQTVVLVPSYNAESQTVTHFFQPANLTILVGEQRISSVNFQDSTVSTFTVSLVGGLCNYAIGTVAPQFVLPSCNNRVFFASMGFGSAQVTYVLPAADFNFIGTSFTASAGLDTLTSGVNGFLQLMGRLQLNLSTNTNVTKVLRYHSPAQVELVGPTWAQAPTCSHSGYPFSIRPQGTLATLIFNVYELYGQICSVIDADRTRVWVRDLVAAEPSSTCYNPGCPVNVTSAGRAIYTTRIGTPYFLQRADGADYTRDLFYGIAGTAAREKNTLSVLATGTYVYEGVDSLKIAPSSLLPAYILRRPPGGSSSAEFSGSFSMSSDVSMDISTGLSSSIGYDIAFSGSLELNYMAAPLGLGTSGPLGGLSLSIDRSGFVPVLPKLPGASTIRERMIVPELNSDVFASVLSTPRAGLYDPSDVLSPFKPSQDCSVFSVITGFAQSVLDNLVSTVEHIVEPLTNSRRRLLAGEFNCESSTEKSLSLGQSRGYSVSVETSADPALIDGQGDMFLFVVHDVLVSFTNVLIAIAPSAAQSADTDYISWNAAQSANLYNLWGPGGGHDSTHCLVMEPHQIKTASSSDDSQLLWVSQSTIEEQIIPFSTVILNEYNSMPQPLDQVTQAFVDSVTASKANWKLILQYNTDLKSQAVPWPELIQYLTFNSSADSSSGAAHDDYSLPFYLEGDDLVVSFSGDMGAIGFSIDRSVDQSTSSGSSLGKDGSSGASLGGQVNVAGFGLSANINWDYSNSEQLGTESSVDSGNERSLSFELSDPDRGDSFDVIIRRDPVYGTPVYITRAGRSRCRQESGTVARESLVLSWPQGFQQQPASDVFSAVLEVANTGLETETEPFSYYLNLDTETNTHGWTVTVNGVPVLRNSVRVNIPTVTGQASTGTTKLLVVVSRGSGAYGAANLRFTITGICYEDIISPTQYAYTPLIPALAVDLEMPSGGSTTLYDAMPVVVAANSMVGAMDGIASTHLYFAVSLRRLFASATRAIQAFRVSDGVTQDIGFLSSGVLDTASLVAFSSHGDVTVSVWYDQSGAGNHLTARSSFSPGPFIVRAGTVVTNGGLPALRFANQVDGGSPVSALFAPAANTVGYMSAVLQRDAGNIGFLLGSLSSYNWHSTSNWAFSTQDCRPAVCSTGSNGTDNGGSNAGNTYQPAYNTPMPDGQINIVSVQTASPSSSDTMWDNIGSDRTSVHNLAAYYYELLVYSQTPSTQDQATILAAQNRVY